VKGGGIVGDALREFMQLPHINDLAYPFHNENHKGYWYLYEVAFGTHPKAFRNPAGLDEGTAIPERLRAGVIHWGSASRCITIPACRRSRRSCSTSRRSIICRAIMDSTRTRISRRTKCG